MKVTLGIIAVLAVATVGCSSGNDYPQVMIGAVIDQTGNNSELSWLQAIRLAIDHANDALAAEGNPSNFRFVINAQNSENDVAGGPDSRAISRIQDVVDAGARAVAIDTTQIAEEANKPQYGFNRPMQCGSCTGGSFLNGATTVATDPELQASRRNDDRWMSRTIMSTALQAVVVSQLIHGDGHNGDLNGDGVIKVANYGSDEAFGQSTTTAVATQVTARYLPANQSLLKYERRLHPNLPDPRDINFGADIDVLTDNATTTQSGSPPMDGATTVDGFFPDYITIATFGRNDVAFTTEFRGRQLTQPKVIHFQPFRFGSNLLTLGELAEGEVGVSHVVLDGPAGEQFAKDFQAKYGLVPVYRDSIYYDNAATLVLATLMAVFEAKGSPPETVDPTRIRDSMPCTSVGAARLITDRPLVVCPAGTAVPVVPGVDGFRAAIRAILAGEPIEYTGASGPVDYDSRGNIKDKVANFTVQNGKFVDLAIYDCVNDPLCPCIDGTCPQASSL